MRTVILFLLVLLCPSLGAEQLHVGVASNFKVTLEEINARFEAQFGHKVIVSSASTGTLYNQVIHGAPFDIIYSADDSSTKKLAETGYGISDQTLCYAKGSLVLVGSDNPDQDLLNPKLSLAIANPVTAPYGKAALEVLHRTPFNSIENRTLVRANNAIQAYQYWYSSAVDMALVPRSLAGDEGTVINTSWYTPIEQHVIMLRRAEHNPAAQSYMRWIGSDTVQEIISAAGYGTCQ